MTFLKHCKTGLLAFWLAPKNPGKSGLHHEHVAPQQTSSAAAHFRSGSVPPPPHNPVERAALVALNHARNDRSQPKSRKVAP